MKKNPIFLLFNFLIIQVMNIATMAVAMKLFVIANQMNISNAPADNALINLFDAMEVKMTLNLDWNLMNNLILCLKITFFSVFFFCAP